MGIPQDLKLISTTDEKGIISYVNEDFCAISGYTIDELVGQEQNIVRHPDMTRAIFKDLWQHLKSGRPWRGAIKNRCKGGRFY